MRRIFTVVSVIILLILTAFAAFADGGEMSVQELWDNARDAVQAQDYKTAAACYRSAADNEKCSESPLCGKILFELGNLYYDGKGVDQSFVLAESYYQKASDFGNDNAMFRLGGIYERGAGLRQSYEKAAFYYRNAAELGHPYAAIALGDLYFAGQGVEQSYEKAETYYRMAAGTFADVTARQKLAQVAPLIAEQRTAVEIRQLQTAADQGDTGAMRLLAGYYERGSGGVEEDQEKASVYYRKLAEAGDPAGQITIGDRYRDGIGVFQSYEKAAEYYRMAADQGSAYAEGEREKALRKSRTVFSGAPEQQFPYTAILDLSILQGGQRFSCSGFMIGPNYALTAGHCLYDKDSGYAADISVCPAMNGVSCTGVSWISVPEQYESALAQNKGNVSAYDIGVLKLDSPVGNRTGWFTVIDYTPVEKIRGIVWALGYDSQSDGHMFQTEAIVREKDVKQYQITSSLHYYDGASGSPLIHILPYGPGLREFTVVGVNISSGRAFDYRSAVRFGEEVSDFIHPYIGK